MDGISADLALVIIRVCVGLLIAGHGAQKVFGVFDGQGLEKWSAAVASMGFAQPRVMATLAAFTEFFGGIAFALGLYVPIVAALLVVDLLVALVKVHWTKGFWVTKGGYEYVLALMAGCAALGLHGATPWSLDEFVGLRGADPVLLFVGTLLIAGAVTAIAGLVHPVPRTRPAA